MTSQAHPALNRDPFQAARNKFEAMLAWLQGPDGPVDHSAAEEGLDKRGKEILRQAEQDWLDTLFTEEKREVAATPPPEGTTVRRHGRQLEGIFGRVVVWRLGYTDGKHATRFPLDGRLNLPEEVYSHPLGKRIVEEGRMGAWNHAVERVDATTGGHVPKRQAEELAIAATVDFNAYYAQRPANDSTSASALLLASSDGKGVRMLPQALREATRKAAEAEAAGAVRGDPMARPKPSQHDKRMAAVTAVWEQEPMVRTAHDIVDELQRSPKTAAAENKPRLPRPQNKRVSASVEKGTAASVSEMFDEVDHRDPERQRPVGILIDGEEHQQTAILTEGARRGRTLTIILDLIHLLHYLWIAGFAICRKDKRKTQTWVADHLLMLLTGPVADVISAIQAAAAASSLSARARKPIDKALKYMNRNAAFMNYYAYLARGMPIASGIIEGACRHLIQDRLGITGARWDLPGADAVLKLRALQTSGDWEAYWRFHLNQEAIRNYPTAA
jgi:hypothetical protein